MPVTEYIGTEIDSQTKEAAARVLERMGFSLSEFLHLTVAKIARDKCLPFDAAAALQEEYNDEIPNALTVETFEKIERGEDIYHAKDLHDLMKQLRS